MGTDEVICCGWGLVVRVRLRGGGLEAWSQTSQKLKSGDCLKEQDMAVEAEETQKQEGAQDGVPRGHGRVSGRWAVSCGSFCSE